MNQLDPSAAAPLSCDSEACDGSAGTSWSAARERGERRMEQVMQNAQRYVLSVLSALAVAGVAAGQAAGTEHAAAGTAPPQEAGGAEAEPSAKPAGILPLPDYGGDLWTRSFLAGDWGGARGDLAEKGIQLTVDFTQFVQSVASGGKSSGTKYGGNLDYLLYIDLYRMNVLPGAMVKIRAQTRYGETANAIAGPLLPVNTYGLFPLTTPLNEVVPITVTDLTYTQFLSEKFGVFVGKFDVLDGDPNEFASGRGTTQFLDANFVFNAVGVLAAPLYSTLGFGVVWKPIEQVTVTSSIFNSKDSSTTSGFQDIGDGTTWSTEAQFQYRIWDLPGGQNLTFVYAFDRSFVDIGRFVFTPGQGIAPMTQNDTWAVLWSLWQYVWTEQPAEAGALIDPTNGTQDLEGLGVFARVGFADHSTNPVPWSASVGVGGRGLIPKRDNDTCGIGYFASGIQETRLAGFMGAGDLSQGIEAYYNIAITPAAHLTFDLQWVEPAAPGVEPAVLLGARLDLTF